MQTREEDLKTKTAIDEKQQEQKRELE